MHEKVIEPVNNRDGEGFVVIVGGGGIVNFGFLGAGDLRPHDVVVVRDGRLAIERLHGGSTIDVRYPEDVTLADLPETVTVTPEARQLLDPAREGEPQPARQSRRGQSDERQDHDAGRQAAQA